ncbi:hypothetical protein AVHY2522_13315 [Acidovorax sp. SUPP2522]|uniref:hypothetical protein n=1 Tax=unclassified Acidovorax TaxID=2684926 RepID=UPI00234B50D2|nr:MULTISPECIES: hypothetical protein [unclassified Acidovorax]WCM96328.1 hypothetical protein M5C96_18070 [Acidovorax sp. GBBC 1281]GKT16892.1 hypothetical protein AVHY2522_13315 [Acidovorax sp. SUPP2522]
MFYAISWFLSLTLLALWSLACWGMHAMAVWAVSSAGALAGGTSAMNAVVVPDWIRGWIPPELAREFAAMIASAGPMVQAALDTVPALAGAVTVLAWALWGLGAVILLAVAFGVHVLIALLKGQRTAHGAPRATVVQ